MTDELKKIIFSPQISKVFSEHNWVINTDPKSKFHSYFFGDIADYYLNVDYHNGKIYLQFTLDIDIPDNKINEILMLINIANQNSKKARPKKKENFGNYVAHLSHFTEED